MQPVPVSIQITGTAAESPYADQLLRACNDAAPESGCVRATEPPTADGNAVAVVEWDEERRLARIRIEVPDASQRVLERRIEFDEDDRENERWRSVGLTIATMIESLTEPPPAEQEPGTTPMPQEHKPRDVRQAPRPVRRKAAVPRATTILWVDGAGLTGPGLDDGPWRWGGQARVWYAPGGGPVLALASVSYAVRVRTQNIAIAWTTFGLGAGYSLKPFAQAELRAHADAVGELVSANANDPTDGESDDGRALDFGVGVGADFAWYVARWLGVVVGGDVVSTTKAVDIRVREAHVARGGPVSYAVFAGARFAVLDAL